MSLLHTEEAEEGDGMIYLLFTVAIYGLGVLLGFVWGKSTK